MSLYKLGSQLHRMDWESKKHLEAVQIKENTKDAPAHSTDSVVSDSET
jgi:hypothetical protein